MKICLMTDVEGVAGVIAFKDYCSPGDRYYEMSKRLLTEEVNAAIDGFFAGGADDITVVDGHGPGAINIELLDERANYERGHHDRIYPWGLDEEGYDAIAFVGQHAKSGTPYSHITHTGSFDCYDLQINGLSVGEYGEIALCGMELGIPTIFASGEEALCREAEALTPGVITAGVKRGLLDDKHKRGLTVLEYSQSKLSAFHLNPKKACKLIRQKAEEAVLAFKADPTQFKFPDIKPPYTLHAEYRSNPEKGAPRRKLQHIENLPTVADAFNTRLLVPAVDIEE